MFLTDRGHSADSLAALDEALERALATYKPLPDMAQVAQALMGFITAPSPGAGEATAARRFHHRARVVHDHLSRSGALCATPGRPKMGACWEITAQITVQALIQPKVSLTMQNILHQVFVTGGGEFTRRFRRNTQVGAILDNFERQCPGGVALEVVLAPVTQALMACQDFEAGCRRAYGALFNPGSPFLVPDLLGSGGRVLKDACLELCAAFPKDPVRDDILCQIFDPASIHPWAEAASAQWNARALAGQVREVRQPGVVRRL